MTTARRTEMAALVALLLFVAGRCLVPMDETDLFFNLRLGELILQRHAVPRTNLLSFTFPDYRDVNLAWLFQLGLVLAHRAGGIAGAVLLKTAFVLATWALLFRVAVRRGAHPAAAAAALALAAWAAEPRFVERPHLVTFLGLGYLLLAIERAEAGRPRALWSLIPLALVWANGNSCFFLAPAVLGLYALGARLDGAAGARRAAILALVLLPFIFATPSGAGALSYIANHWRMPWLRPLQEYRPATWPLDGPFFFVAAGVVAAAALPGRRLRHLLPALALGLLGARRIRFVAEFAILSGPILAVLLTGLAGRVVRRARGLAGTPFATIAAVAALAGLTLVPRLAAVRQGERFVDLGLEEGLVPTAAIQFVDDNHLGDRMYNDLEVGSYLTWHWRNAWPWRRVFQDPRINGYPPAFHAFLKRDDVSRADWKALLDRFGVTSALVTFPDLNPRAALFDPASWALVYRDGEALVFAARGGAFGALIARDEIPLRFSYARGAGVTAQPLDDRPSASPVTPCDWQKRLGDVRLELGDDAWARAAYEAVAAHCPDAAARDAAALARGDLALKAGDAAGAVEAYAGLRDPRARANRGLALMSLGRAREAEADLRAALAADPNQPEARLGLAFALEALHRDDDAVAAFRAFLALAPDHAAAARARAEIDRLSRRRAGR